MILTDPLPPALTAFVRRFVVRRRRLNVLQAVGRAIAFILIWTLIWSFFDRLLPTPNWFRTVLLLIEIAAAAVLLIRPVRKLFSAEIPWHQAAAAIELRDPQFGGRLQTALSQLLMPSNQRGSAFLLAQVVDETAARAASVDPNILLPPQQALRPAAIATTALVVVGVLFASSWLDLPRLLKRQLMPFLNTAPVTTTQISVSPGNADVIEGESLKITVRAQRIGDSQPLLQWRGDDPLFSSAIMPPESAGFAYTFSSIDRPFTYRVSAGDATSALFAVHITARPSVRELRVAYTYPDWTELPPRPAAQFNGDLEGPAGTIAVVSITGSEALAKADCLFNGKRFESTPSVDPAVRLLSIPMLSNGNWQIELADAHGITGTGSSGMTMRVFPAQPPRADLRLPTEEDELRLHPRDMLTLGYEASDQYALAHISAQVAINSAPATSVEIPLGTNHRSQSGSFDVDLARLAVNLGDVVTITLAAENKAGLHRISDPCRIVISPRSIDLNAEQRLSELREAARLAKALGDETQAASKALEKSPPGDAKESRDEKVSPRLAIADSLAASLSRQLLLALTHTSSTELSNALVFMIDATQRSASSIEAANEMILTEMRDPLHDRLNRVAGMSHHIEQPLDLFWRGEYASQLLAKAKDAEADEARLGALAGAPAETLKRSAQQARSDESEGCTQLGIDPHAADVESQLQQRVDQASDAVKHFGFIDFASAANEWAAAGAAGGTGLVARLTIGSHAETVRPSGDFIWARDLELSARAARHIDTSGDIPANARTDYPGALKALQDLHRLVVSRANSERLTQPMKIADEARRLMRLWAGDSEASSQPASDPERDALEAAAAEAQQKIEQDARLDHATTMASGVSPFLDQAPTLSATMESPATSPETEKFDQAIATERKLERLTAEQRMLRRETARASVTNLQDMAKQQSALTDAIQNARPDRPSSDQTTEDVPRDSRESAMNAIRAAQERLAQMPEEIETARKSEDQQHAASKAAADAKLQADAADPDHKDADDTAADAARTAAEAAKKQAATAQVSPDQSSNLSASLRKFAPETTPAVDAIDQQLTPALAAMRQAQSAEDHDASQRAAQQAKEAVAEAQKRLSGGLQSLLERDALTTAKFFSSNAAQALAKPNPDRAGAMKLQRGASAALEQAWDDALRQAAGQRLAHVPSISAIALLNPAENATSGANPLGAEAAPSEREWGRLREQQPGDLTAGSHEIDPPEYQDALRVYFRDLAREDAGAKP